MWVESVMWLRFCVASATVSFQIEGGLQMAKSKFGPLMAIAGFAMSLPLLTACGGPPPPHGVVYVRTAPPGRMREVITIRPGNDHYWVAGHHTWNGNDYIWTPGRWERGPHARAKWVSGHWHRNRSGWYWTEGRWK